MILQNYSENEELLEIPYQESDEDNDWLDEEVENYLVPITSKYLERPLFHTPQGGNWDPEKITVDELFQASLIIMEVGAIEPINQILGGICIWDLEGISLSHAWNMTPSIAYKMMQIMTTSFPMKVHAFHIVNQNWAFDIGYNIFKPLITDERMRQRLHIHGTNYEALHKHIDPKYLPKQYGGELSNYNSFYDWYISMRKEVRVLKELKLLGYSDDAEEAKLDEETRKALNSPL